MVLHFDLICEYAFIKILEGSKSESPPKGAGPVAVARGRLGDESGPAVGRGGANITCGPAGWRAAGGVWWLNGEL